MTYRSHEINDTIDLTYIEESDVIQVVAGENEYDSSGAGWMNESEVRAMVEQLNFWLENRSFKTEGGNEASRSQEIED